jgi:hypothetical protein
MQLPKGEKMLTKEQILSADDLATELVEVPEWGGSVTVRAMTGTQRAEFENALVADKKAGRTNLFYSRVAAFSIVDEAGKCMFTEGDMAALGKKSAKALDRVFRAGCRLSGIGEAEIREMEKNSKKTASDASL